MVRCSKCKKYFHKGKGKSWKDGVCRKCCYEPKQKDTLPLPKVITRKIFVPTDLYLDLYTPQEMKNLDN